MWLDNRLLFKFYIVNDINVFNMYPEKVLILLLDTWVGVCKGTHGAS